MILVCGEALFDMFAGAPSEMPLTFEAHIGGSPFNVAFGLARLGQDAAFFGGISRDTLGGKLMNKLQTEGVSAAYVHRSDFLTTLSIVQKDELGQPAYTFYGERAADRMVTEADLPSFSEAPKAIHVGSYTALVEPVASALKALIRRERGNALISFDPNIRPTVVGDMALWRANTEEIVALADLIKVSDEDLQLIHPGRPVEDIAREWLAKGARLVIVTRGGEGAVGFTQEAVASVPGRTIKVADTVGAGDTFQAALLTGLTLLNITTREALGRIAGDDLKLLLEFAAAAAAITCTRRGADLPRADELAAEISQLQK